MVIQYIYMIYTQQLYKKSKLMSNDMKSRISFWENQKSPITNNNNSTSENTKIGKIASPELNDKQNKDRKNSMDIGQRKKEQNIHGSESQQKNSNNVSYQIERQSVADIKKNFEGKLKFGPATSVNSTNSINSLKKQQSPIISPIPTSTHPKDKPEIKKQQPTLNTNNNVYSNHQTYIQKQQKIPKFHQSAINLQAIFAKKPKNYQQGKTQQKKKTQTKQEIQQTPDQIEQDKSEFKQKFIHVGNKKLLSSAMKGSSLTPQQRADLIIRKIFGDVIELETQNQIQKQAQNTLQQPQLIIRNKNKGKADLGQFDDA